MFSPEYKLKPEVLPLSVFGLFVIAFSAFSRGVRKEIGKRDDWTCQEDGCNKNFQDGYWVEASHYDHSRENPDYNKEHNGRILCRDHHAQDHFNMNDPSLTEKEHISAGKSIEARDDRTRDWKSKNGKS